MVPEWASAKVLVLNATPDDQGRIRPDKEAGELRERMAAMPYPRRLLVFEHVWATRLDQIQQELVRHSPTILHFSGHGAPGELAFEKRDGTTAILEGRMLARILHAYRSLECLVLHACYAEEVAQACLPHVRFVVGSVGSIDDEVAPRFSYLFYQSLAGGLDYEQAFELGQTEVAIASEDAAGKYKMLTKEGSAAAPAEVRKTHRSTPFRRAVVVSPGLAPTRKVEGRTKEIDVVAISLAEARDVVLTGEGGIGKSTLAREYAHGQLTRFFGIWWVAADTPEKLIESLCELAVALKVVEGGAHIEKRAVAKAVLSQLGQSGDPWLLIYDNVSKPAVLIEWLPEGERVRVIVTSRPDSAWPPRFDVKELKKLDCEDESDPAVTVLLAAARRDDRTAALTLAKELEGLPLALVIAGGYLFGTKITFETYARQWTKVVLEQEHLPDDYPMSLYRSVKISYDALSKDARALANTFSFLSPDGLEERLIADLLVGSIEWTRDLPEVIARLANDKTRLDRAFADLCKWRFLEAGIDRGYSLHRLNAVAVRHILGSEGRDWVKTAALVAAANFPTDVLNYDTWPDCARMTSHVAALFDAKGSGGLSLAPETEAAMAYGLNQAALYLSHQAEHARAVDFSRKALEQRSKLFAMDDYRVLQTYIVLGTALVGAGDLPGALEVYEEGYRRILSLGYNTNNRKSLSSLVRRQLIAMVHNYGYAVELHSSSHGAEMMNLMQAKRSYQESLLLLRESDIDNARRKQLMAVRFTNLASVRLKLGQVLAARRLAEFGASVGIISNFESRVRNIKIRAEIKASLGEYGAAASLFEAALTMAHREYKRADHHVVMEVERARSAAHRARSGLGPGSPVAPTKV